MTDETARRLAVIGSRMVGKPGKPRAFKCDECRDEGFHPVGGWRMWFCTCALGENKELAHWYRKVWLPGPRGKRVHSSYGQAELSKYIRSGGIQARGIGLAFDVYVLNRGTKNKP